MVPKYIEARREAYAESARRRDRNRGEPHGALSERAKEILSMSDRVQAARGERAAARVGREMARRATEASEAAKIDARAERDARREAVRMAAASRFKVKLDRLRSRAAEKEERPAIGAPLGALLLAHQRQPMTAWTQLFTRPSSSSGSSLSTRAACTRTFGR